LEQSLAGFRKEKASYVCTVLAYLAHVECTLGDLRRAREVLHRALQTSTDTQAFFPIVLALPAVALLLVKQGQVERALEMYALALRYRQVSNSRWFEDVAGRRIAAAAAGLPQDAVAAAQERGRARDLWATVEELLAELE
jgi:ATP/maltotriose-dependent transcriptional regulator MalT